MNLQWKQSPGMENIWAKAPGSPPALYSISQVESGKVYVLRLVPSGSPRNGRVLTRRATIYQCRQDAAEHAKKTGA